MDNQDITPKIYALGETTYDIIFKDDKPIDAKVGGSQLNTAVSLGRLGLPTSFISQTGSDRVGDISLKFLEENNIDTNNISVHKENSRIALAFLDEKNNAQYTFYKPSISCQLQYPEIQKGDIILIGSSFAYKPEIRNDLLSFLSNAKKKGGFIIYDPNFRSPHIHQLPQVKPLIEENIRMADIVKASDEDCLNIFQVKSGKEAYKAMKGLSKCSFIYTKGADGVELFTKNITKSYDIPPIDTQSTIGAGDTFNAGIIYSLFSKKLLPDALKDIPINFWDKLIETSVIFSQHVCQSFDNYISIDLAEKYYSEH